MRGESLPNDAGGLSEHVSLRCGTGGPETEYNIRKVLLTCVCVSICTIRIPLQEHLHMDRKI